MNTVDIHTFDTKTTRGATRRRAAIAIVGALALGLAAIAFLGAETNVTGEIFAWLGDYITKVGEALGTG